MQLNRSSYLLRIILPLPKQDMDMLEELQDLREQVLSVIATLLAQGNSKLPHNNDSSRLSLCFEDRHEEEDSQLQAGIARFTDLPHAVMTIVARELARVHQRTVDAFDLIPMRLLSRRFTPAITRWIFHTSTVLMNQLNVNNRTPQREPPWMMRRHFMKAMRRSWAVNSVVDLTCMTRLARGNYLVREIQSSLLVLAKTSKTIRRLHFDAEVRDNVLIDAELPHILTNTLENLQVLVLNPALLFLLVPLLDSAPRLHFVCLQGGGHLPFSVRRADELLAQREDRHRRPERTALRVLRLDDHRYMTYQSFLQKSGLRAKHIQVGLAFIYPENLNSFLMSQARAGLQNFPLFQKCDKITLLSRDFKTSRLEIRQPLAQNMLAEIVKSQQQPR